MGLDKGMTQYLSPTPGERLILWRRRKNFTQRQAAKIFEISPHIVSMWEQGTKHNAPYIELYVIREYERCFLVRYRNQLPIKVMATTLGVSSILFSRWERGIGRFEKLIDYYESLGWKIDNKHYT